MSVFLQTAARFLVQIILLLSILLVLRGHNYPGGGFIGSLVATSSIGLYTLAFGLKTSGFDRWSPLIIVLGLILLLISISVSLLFSQPILTGIWINIPFWSKGLKLGTPLLFDFGIYFLIVGSLSWLIVELEDESS